VHRAKIARVWLLVAVVAALAQVVAVAQPPYDPRPLAAAAGPEDAAPFTFAVFGDSYANPPLAGLMKMVALRKPVLAVTTGDMVAVGADASDWEILSRRAGWFLKSIPTWPVIGNHELNGGETAGRSNFERFYALPSVSYSFSFRRCKFIVMGYDMRQKDELSFLRQELADRNRYDYVFVFRHAPFYTVGWKSARQVPNRQTEVTELFEQRRVTAVFSGHDHIYYRTRRGGVCYITAGIAGAGIYELKRRDESVPGDAYMGTEGSRFVLHVPGTPDRIVPRNQSSASDWLFAVFVRVDGERVTAQTVPVKGEVWDEFSLLSAARPEAATVR
jgi:hypothetical protein